MSQHAGLGIASLAIALGVSVLSILFVAIAVVGMLWPNTGLGAATAGTTLLYATGVGVTLALIGMGLAFVALIASPQSIQLTPWLGLLFNGVAILFMLSACFVGSLLEASKHWG